MSRRTDQAAATIQSAVQQVIQRGLNDPRAHALITVTGVRVTDDLQEAFVSVSVLPAERQELVIHALRDAAAYIRREVGEIVDARKLPKFQFRLDHSLKKQAGILTALNEVAEERRRRGIPDPDPAADGARKTPETEGPAA